MAIRKRTSALTPAERDRFKTLVNGLIANGTYAQLVAIHADMSHNMHSMNSVGTQRFLSWHRVYLLKIEAEMRKIDPLAVLPYWDWTRQRAIPSWLEDFKPSVQVPGVGWVDVTRDPLPPSQLPTLPEIRAILNARSYQSLTVLLEGGPHNGVHVWCNGTMSELDNAPADPIFWLHHAQIDRLWSVWQESHPTLNPSLSGKNAIMDPWPEKAADVKSIVKLKYAYGP